MLLCTRSNKHWRVLALYQYGTELTEKTVTNPASDHSVFAGAMKERMLCLRMPSQTCMH